MTVMVTCPGLPLVPDDRDVAPCPPALPPPRVVPANPGLATIWEGPRSSVAPLPPLPPDALEPPKVVLPPELPFCASAVSEALAPPPPPPAPNSHARTRNTSAGTVQLPEPVRSCEAPTPLSQGALLSRVAMAMGLSRKRLLMRDRMGATG